MNLAEEIHLIRWVHVLTVKDGDKWKLIYMNRFFNSVYNKHKQYKIRWIKC